MSSCTSEIIYTRDNKINKKHLHTRKCILHKRM